MAPCFPPVMNAFFERFPYLMRHLHAARVGVDDVRGVMSVYMYRVCYIAPAHMAIDRQKVSRCK